MKNRIQILSIALALLFVAATSQAASETIPAGATIAVRMMETIDSKTNHVGEMFRATLNSPLRVNGRIVIPQGAEAIGRLTVVEQGGRIRGRPILALELTALNFAGQSIAIRTSFYQEAGSSRGKETAKVAGGGGLLGGVMGAVAGGKKGSVIGAGIGAAAGTIVQTVRGTERLRIPAESLVLFTLQSPVRVNTDL